MNTVIDYLNTELSELESAFHFFSQTDVMWRSNLMESVARNILEQADVLIPIAERETHLSRLRLESELARTVFQWNSYAKACRTGRWMNISIEHGDPARVPPKPELRKTSMGIGPVAVFGAGNFPFAYSTAGGDTASAWAAGCPVVVKAHPGHPETSNAMARIIERVLEKQEIRHRLFLHVEDSRNETGLFLASHPAIKAVAFTGSFSAGMALQKAASDRRIPIPVFAEMGSLNPVFLLPDRLQHKPESLALELIASATLSVGQFCTKPGLIIALDSKELDLFAAQIQKTIAQTNSARMLNDQVLDRYKKNSRSILNEEGISLLALGQESEDSDLGKAIFASVSADHFLSNTKFREEVFGPFSMLVKCKNVEEMNLVASQLPGQLTCSLYATEKDVQSFSVLIRKLKYACGRLILNGVPTGVEVSQAMHHGGPFPASTDSRFGSVGEDAIRRFARPICFQNPIPELLPVELQNENLCAVWRWVDGSLTQDAL